MTEQTNELSPINWDTTPIARLIELGFDNEKIASICGVGISGVSKWRTRTNNATAYAQQRAKAYLDVYDKEIVNIPAKEEPKDDHMFMVMVPSNKLDRFHKILLMLDLNGVNMDS